jgi:hypothetical protein
VGRHRERDPVTFVVRVAPGEGSRLSGVVERVRTGEKHRFVGNAAIGRIITRIVTEERRRSRGDR